MSLYCKKTIILIQNAIKEHIIEAPLCLITSQRRTARVSAKNV